MRVQDLYSIPNAETGQTGATQPGKTHQTGEVTSTPARAATAAGPLPEPDQVELSDLTGRLSRLLGAEHPDRAARLERLAAEVQSGRYHVDAPALSRRLIDEALRGG